MAIRALTRSELTALTIADVMHPGVLTCPPTRLCGRSRGCSRRTTCTASSFSSRRTTGNLASRCGGSSPTSISSSAASSAGLDDRTAGGSAATPVVVVSGRDSLDRAVELMKEHGTSHLVVVEPDTMQPVGGLSALDVAAALAGARGSGSPGTSG